MATTLDYIDLFEKCRTNQGYYGRQRVEDDHYFTRPILQAKADRIMEFEGKPRIMWSVNNYLGLAGNDEVNRVAIQAIQEYGVSSPMGSRMMTGNTLHHLDFERQLAEFTEKEAAILFNYGYMGVIGTISSLVGPDDIIVMDKLAHASIVDAAFLAPGQVRVFKHNNPADLESVLSRINKERKGGVLILVEGVYGMTGDLARLDEIAEIKERYGARLFVDDAHGWGVMGDQGRGTADYFGVQDKVDLYFGTFAKSFASIGGFTATTKEARDWISYNARTQVFAKSLPMVYVKSLQKTFELVTGGDENRKRMWENSGAMKEGLKELGYFVGRGNSPICSVFVPTGSEDVEAIGKRMMRFLRDEGVFVTAITYPVIPLGLCMFRIIPTAAHTAEDISQTLAAYKAMRDEFGLKLAMEDEDLMKVQKVYGKGNM